MTASVDASRWDLYGECLPAHTAPAASGRFQEHAMTLCPIAIVAGCKSCPAFKVCPLKGVIGDAKPADDAPKAKPGAGAPPRKR